MTLTAAEVVEWPRESVATAVSVWLAFEKATVFHEVENEGPVPGTVANAVPSTRNCTEDIVAGDDALAVA